MGVGPKQGPPEGTVHTDRPQVPRRLAHRPRPHFKLTPPELNLPTERAPRTQAPLKKCVSPRTQTNPVLTIVDVRSDSKRQSVAQALEKCVRSFAEETRQPDRGAATQGNLSRMCRPQFGILKCVPP